MKIAVIGAGTIGRTLATRLAPSGQEVVVGLRDPESDAARAVREAAPEVSVATVRGALADADVVVIAIPGAQLPGFVEEWADALDARIVLDATNRAGGETFHAMEQWRRHVPGARVFRAFCTVGWETMADPEYRGVEADLFFCGPDGEPRATAEAVIRDVGLRPVWIGDETAADLLDGVTRLWFQLAYAVGRGRNIAFKLLER
jgi:predicted dinucleotide-binding enzyme